MIWSVFEKVSQSNSRFNALDTFVVTVHSVTMTVDFGKNVLKSRGIPLAVIAHLKSSGGEIRRELLSACLGNSECKGR